MAKKSHARISCLLRPAAAVLSLLCILSLSSVQAFSSLQYRQIAQLPSHRRTCEPSVGRTHPQNTLLRRHAATLNSGEKPIGYDPLETANGIAPETKRLPQSLKYYIRFVVERIVKNRLDKKIKSYKKGRRRAMWTSLNEQRKNLISLAGYTSHIVAPSFVFLFLGALMASVRPHYYSTCMQLVSTLSGTKQELIKAILGLGIVSIMEALFTGLRGSLFWIGGSRANYNVRVKLHRSLLLQEAAFFDMNETGYLLSRLNSDVNKIGMVISYHVNVVLRQLAQFIFGSIYLFNIAPKLSMWTFLGIGLVAYVSAVYGDFARDLAEKVQDTFADATAVAETSFSMSETIRAFDGVETESGKFEEAQGKALDLEEVQAWAYGSHKFVSDALQSIFQVALLAACWGVGRAGGLPAPQLTTFMFYTNFVLESSNEVGDQWAKIQSAVGASTSVFELIKRVPSIRDPRPPQAIGGAKAPVVKKIRTSSEISSLDRVNGDDKAELPIISIKNMTVTYGAMETPALSQVDLDIYPGERVAIVGRSGSGKSSLLRTIMRFYDPSTGSISLDGVPLTGMSRSETASKISVVEQEPHLFPMTLIENVLYGIDKDETDPETGELQYSASYRRAVSDSLSLAGLPIHPGNDLGLELDTRVGEGGRSLSGGQRQRVAIARAVIRSPRVLLLDEPTAALDSQSEKKVVAALQHSMEHTKSMVMVTHRLGVIRALNVNRVVVLEQGKIVENGHPEELLLNYDSLYAALAREQGITAIDPLLHVHTHKTPQQL